MKCEDFTDQLEKMYPKLKWVDIQKKINVVIKEALVTLSRWSFLSFACFFVVWMKKESLFLDLCIWEGGANVFIRASVKENLSVTSSKNFGDR